jgi:hypothetical protein
VVVPDEVLAKGLELRVDGLVVSEEDKGRVVAVAGAMVVDASPWKVDDGFTTVPPLTPVDPVEVPIEREALEAAAFGFVTRDCVVGGEGMVSRLLIQDASSVCGAEGTSSG